MLKPRECVRNLSRYRPPLARRTGLRLDFNENTTSCSPRVLGQLRSLTAEDLARYPEREPLEQLVAAHLGLRADQVLLTNGVDEAIHLLCAAYLADGDEALIPVPAFAMYAISAAAAGARVIQVPADRDFRFPLDRILESLTDRTRLIAIANPNNPTGTVAAEADLLAIAQRAPNAAVLIDEAYFDFYGQTMMSFIESVPNLFVARTFSKAYGLAGLRVGILAGAAEQISMLKAVASPYNVNAVALACLPSALADQDYLTSYVAAVKQQRDRLEHQLQALGIPCWPSQANFVLANFGPQRSVVVQGMRDRSILVRDRSSDPGCDGCIRITAGTRPQMDAALAALREIIAHPAEVSR